MPKHLVFVALLGLTALVPACTGEPAVEAVLTPTVEPTVVRTKQSTSTAVISYQRSGGIAGIVEHWSIYPDGRVVSSSGQEHTVPAEEVAVLLAEIDALGFFELTGAAGLPNMCADCFVHELTVTSGERLNSITISGRIADPQDPRAKILMELNEFLYHSSN